MTVIVILALVALFIGLRLYSVLGERTGHEQQPILKPADPDARVEPRRDAARPSVPQAVERWRATWRSCRPPARACARSSPRIRRFDVARFLEGAKAAYRLVLEAYLEAASWTRSRRTSTTMSTTRSTAAIEQRKKDGLELDNRLVAIEQAVISEASLERQVAVVTVRFEADIAAVTRNAEGEVVAGSLERRGADPRPVDVPPRHRVARPQLAADRNRRGRVRLAGTRARARHRSHFSPPARPSRCRQVRRQPRSPAPAPAPAPAPLPAPPPGPIPRQRPRCRGHDRGAAHASPRRGGRARLPPSAQAARRWSGGRTVRG